MEFNTLMYNQYLAQMMASGPKKQKKKQNKSQKLFEFLSLKERSDISNKISSCFLNMKKIHQSYNIWNQNYYCK